MSEAPPPFSMPQQPAPRGNRTLWIVLGILAFLGCACCGVFGYFGYVAFRDVLPVAQCGITFEGAREAILAYAEDKGTLPKAESWQDDVKPYYEKIAARVPEDQPFKLLPADSTWGCKAGDTLTGMAYNADLSGKKLSEIEEPYETIVLFETTERKRNLALKFQPRGAGEGPPLALGQRRPWIDMPLKGKGNIGFENGRMRIEGLEEGGRPSSGASDTSGGR